MADVSLPLLCALDCAASLLSSRRPLLACAEDESARAALEARFGEGLAWLQHPDCATQAAGGLSVAAGPRDLIELCHRIAVGGHVALIVEGALTRAARRKFRQPAPEQPPGDAFRLMTRRCIGSWRSLRFAAQRRLFMAASRPELADRAEAAYRQSLWDVSGGPSLYTLRVFERR